MTGKSMLLEVLGNYGLGVEFGDPYRFQVKEEEGPTDKIASYTFFTRDTQRFPRPITFIDTPGFQRGRLEDDRTLMNDIRGFIHRNHYHGIHAVIYVVTGSQGRLTAEQRMVLGNMAEVLGDESAGISFLFCTFADSRHLPVLESVREVGLRYQKYFVVNSSSYFANEEDEDEPSTDDEEDWMKTKAGSINELLWKVTTENIQEFVGILSTRLIALGWIGNDVAELSRDENDDESHYSIGVIPPLPDEDVSGPNAKILGWIPRGIKRSQRTRYNGILSDSLPLTCGIPQGTVFGPLLFSVMVNDDVQVGAQVFKYVDDKTHPKNSIPEHQPPASDRSQGIKTIIHAQDLKILWSAP
ncbi:unnamed protein product [Darwinula stevensoni]|uniref:AIG1-type G domain-containing protein n=1 Tax=Darwinula stevensoni TaxID=69355 RepID=A0A7R8XCY0_9CRUS|nr:unnamed protein product [Darwinula stevensoni]CAG0888215.1 unnamed protein product [Darwinula stevensoni]